MKQEVEDLGETEDLKDMHPAKVAELHVKQNSWSEEVGADPMRPKPEYEEKKDEAAVPHSAQPS